MPIVTGLREPAACEMLPQSQRAKRLFPPKHMRTADFEVSTERGRLDIDLIHDFLSRSSYWAMGRERDTVERSIQNSLCFGIYHRGRQVGFARVITDYAVFGYLADVFVIPEFRGRGLSKRLMQAVFEHQDVKSLSLVLLRTRDAGGLYAQFGFDAVPNPTEMMRRSASA